MTTAEILNLLFKRFSAGRVKILNCDQIGCDVVIGGHTYSIARLSTGLLSVEECVEGDVTDTTPGSQWIEAILLGKTRDDHGRMIGAE